MPLKTLVKVGALTHLSDARYCAGMGVNMLGFKVIPGEPDYISPPKFQEIRGWITGPQIVAELYGLRDPAPVSQIMQDYKPDYVEIGLAEIAIIPALPLPYILCLKDNEALPELATKPVYVLVTDPARYRDIDIPLLAATDSPEKANDALTLPNVKGIAMHGGAEISPGLKDYESLASVLEVLEDEG